MRTLSAFLLLSVFAAAGPPRAQAQDDVVMKAMHDELDRSIRQLHLENLDKPYFISYRVIDSDSTNVSASFGALNSSHQGRSAILTLRYESAATSWTTRTSARSDSTCPA